MVKGRGTNVKPTLNVLLLIVVVRIRSSPILVVAGAPVRRKIAREAYSADDYEVSGSFEYL